MCTVFIAPPMEFTVLLCFLVSALTPVCNSHVSREVRYECGPHGKFEYCIDDVPGCVVGCHCHPGYYFDTESKICEPNVKLTQHFRQHYFAEPTPTATTYSSTPTATAFYDDKVHEIPKDTDELGDWLYNQFFKTIETQVINNSNNTKPSNEKPPTRRSGGGTAIKKSKRKPRKSVRGRKKRKHMKDRGLRKKLLRITEDDSLFDSGSDSDSDSDYSDSSSTESKSSDDDDSADIDSGSDAQKNTDTENCDDKDHGHKKVIIFNRRPKPPLPSFIFLPSMDTSYYPPIGLPPPPLVPMYPMVPVPPMAPPNFPPFPGPPNCGDDSSKTTTKGEPTTTSSVDPATTTTTTTTTTELASESTTESTTEATTETTTEGSLRDGVNRRNRPGKHRKIPNLEKLIARASRPGKPKNLKHGQQNMLMQKLRDKLKGKRRNSLSPTDAISVEELQDDDLQNSEDVPNISEDSTPHKRLHHEDQEETNFPKLEDVDFKYLSELIHRVNQSKSRRRPPLPFDLNEDLKELQKLQSSLPTRRNIGSYKPIPQVHTQGADDIYYSNLGKQIASIIRNADSNVDQQFIKDSEHANRRVPFHSVLNENIYAPRSFWERSVRSPVPQKGPLSEYLDESRTLKHSNEKSLINLENEVEIFASTPSALSLQDLENILSTMEKAHAEIKFRQPMMSTKQSNVSMNVNLLPKHVRTGTFIFDIPEKVEYVTHHYQTPLPPRIYVEMHPAVVRNVSVFHEPETKYNVPYTDYWVYSPERIQPKTRPRPIQPKTRPRPVIAQTSKPIMRDNQVYNTNTMRQPFVAVMRPKDTEANKSHGRYLQFVNSRPHNKQATSKTGEPKVVKYKSLNYFSGNKHYMFEAASYPLLVPIKSQISKRVPSQPSYFHKQSHHFEYFD